MKNASTLRVPTPKSKNPLLQYTLKGQAAELEEQAVSQQPLLGNICLGGQGTVICAPPNAGKTLITLYLIIDAIDAGRIEGDKVIYVNADDTTQGIADKVRLLDEYGVHMIAQGYAGFKASMLTGAVEEMISGDTARGMFLILDTFKKFTQPMSKRETSEFTDVIRRFVLKGGTLLCLSHTNKNTNADGKNVFAGVSDIIDDLDCAYVVDLAQGDDGKRVAVFTNRKRRGNTPDVVAYSYDPDPALSYIERLTTVRETDLPDDKYGGSDKEAEVQDDDILQDIAMFIEHGEAMGKMAIVKATAGKLGCSKRKVLTLLDQHTGDDPAVHRWTYAVRHRGLFAYELLGQPPGG